MELNFRTEWPDLDAENWMWMKDGRVDQHTGLIAVEHRNVQDVSNTAEASKLRLMAPKNSQEVGTVNEGNDDAQQTGSGWFRNQKLLWGALIILGYALITRILDEAA